MNVPIAAGPLVRRTGAQSVFLVTDAAARSKPARDR